MKGGKRLGAGRPKGGGKYGESTVVMRIPESQVYSVKQLIDNGLQLRMPYYSSKVRAGFPSPADDFVEKYVDLNELLIKDPAATFFVIAEGDSMINAGIRCGDKLIVDRSIEAVDGKIVIAAVNGELTVKRLSCRNGKVKLLPENDNFEAIDITDEQNLYIWGVVQYVIHAMD